MPYQLHCKPAPPEELLDELELLEELELLDEFELLLDELDELFELEELLELDELLELEELELEELDEDELLDPPVHTFITPPEPDWLSQVLRPIQLMLFSQPQPES